MSELCTKTYEASHSSDWWKPKQYRIWDTFTVPEAKFSGIKVLLLNDEKKSQILTKGTAWRAAYPSSNGLSIDQSTRFGAARRRHKRREGSYWQVDDEVTRRHDEWAAKAGENFAVLLRKYYLDRRTRCWTDEFGRAPNWYLQTPTDSAGSLAWSVLTLLIRLDR